MPEQLLEADSIRSLAEERLDAEVATRIMGYRWVRWNRAAIGGAPLYEPGRFLARPDDISGHLQETAEADEPLHDRPLKRVPTYSGSEDLAFEVARTAGLFLRGKAMLFRNAAGAWVVEVRGASVASSSLPDILCRASLLWLEAEEAEGA